MIIQDRLAVIAGAASGIGKATVEDIASRGAKAIAMVDRPDNIGDVTSKMNKDADWHPPAGT